MRLHFFRQIIFCCIVCTYTYAIGNMIRVAMHQYCWIRQQLREKTEKTAAPNLPLEGFDVIEEIKTQLEETCPGSKTSLWKVLTGRRDGKISIASEALANLISPFSNFNTLKKGFEKKSLTVHDLVVLSGAHTIGVGHCNLFRKRLYNFTGNGDAGPSLDAEYAAFLKTKCLNLSDNTSIVGMDRDSSLSFDNHYFKQLKLNQGLFQSDAALLTDNEAANIVEELGANSDKYFSEFAQSMKRMGAIGVLTGSSGEIRKKCNVVNS
ncbi:peroxidase 56-like isoform X2 [Ziziphus jujuba]|uniref:peroxidase n=1 Tax=Ziziphus jujuba TaxID=326968 RepID=A0ABM3ZWX8_ZIZJJ|nr:peroxidase 56-like isoform X2 [Ziziphus jujuba]